ncbi:hypothetical protein RJ639_045104 [Escallonia herrerae]|uniref:Major facilitator superfamily (MFS) profile domain-containing protein n=1 Tax=Escallonia herrerae TaxID=1293975 RepID=A0AA89B1M8_9ASTE|nr:hypothetical protein RJ639_045104 [Escallonia herrerae]
MADRKLQDNGVSGQPKIAAIQDFDPPTRPKRNKYALGCAVLASMTSILLGYDIGVMSGAAIYIKDDLKVSDVQIEILVGIINLYCLFGSAAAGKTSDWIGRRYTIVFAAGIFFVGALLMGFATDYAFLMVGRFVAGIGVGYALMIAPVYTAEVSPASSRGFLTSFPEVFINGGILLGYVSNYAFSKLPTHLGWRFMLGVGAIPSVFLSLGVLAMPESPRWLVMQGRLGDAKRVLDKTSDSLKESQLRLVDIKEAAGIPEHCNDEVVQIPKRPRNEAVWRELLVHPTPSVRHILIAGIGIHFFQQASGIDAVVLYSPRIFEKAGITDDTDKLLATIAVGATKTVFILVATFLLDKIGRRPLLLSSVAGMITSLMLLGVGLTVIDHSDHKLNWAVALSIAAVLAYVSFFSIGMGPITWVYSSEIFPLKLRAQGCSMGVAVNRVTSGVISMTFISLYKAISIGGAFFLFTAVSSVAWVFFYTLLPETQGQNLEEVELLFGTFFNWRSTQRKLKNKEGGEGQVELLETLYLSTSPATLPCHKHTLLFEHHKTKTMVADRKHGVSGHPEVAALDFEAPKKPKRNKYAFGCTILASMTSILLGYDIGVMSGAAIYIKDDLKVSDVKIEILVGILNVYSLIGSAAAGRTSDWIGRRYTIIFAAGIFFVGALLMGFATDYAFLMVGRFVAGIGVGYALMIAPVYTAEVSAASSRGFLTSFPEVFINLGILLGYVSNYAFSKLPTNLGWRFMLGIGAVPSVFLALGVLAMPESPRWLVMQGRLGDAKRVLDKTSDSAEESQLRLADIKEAAGIPETCNDDVVQLPKRTRGEAVWRELLVHPTPSVRHALLAACGIHFFQQATGIDAVVLYSPRIFAKAGITNDTHKLLATIAVGFTKTCFILVATFFLDKIGRRKLLLSSVAGMILSLMLLGVGLTIIDHSEKKLIWAVALSLASVLSYVSFFSIGMGPITWVYSSEIFPLRLRAQGCSMGVAVNRVTSGVLSMTFISLYKAITIGGAFFLFTAIAAVGWVFFYTLYPETRGLNLEEVETVFGTFFHWRSTMRKLKNKKVGNGDGHVQLGSNGQS